MAQALAFIWFPMMMMMMFLFPFSFAQPIAVKSFMIPQVKDNQQASGACQYTVQINTSCLSPPKTNDYIAIKFGASFYHRVNKQINGSRRAFRNCSSDTFNIQGPCTNETICYLYLGRYGNDGWRPDTVSVQKLNSRDRSMFKFGSVLPNNIWCGVDRCSISSRSNNASAPESAAVPNEPEPAAVPNDYRDGYHCTA